MASYNLGLMYLAGLDVRRDDVEAVVWLSQASARGVGLADAILGDIHDHDDKSGWNMVVADYRRAAGRGVVRAQVKLGAMLNGPAGLRWSPAAARHGSVDGARQAGETYGEDESCDASAHRGRCDPVQQWKWLSVAAATPRRSSSWRIWPRGARISTLSIVPRSPCTSGHWTAARPPPPATTSSSTAASRLPTGTGRMPNGGRFSPTRRAAKTSSFAAEREAS